MREPVLQAVICRQKNFLNRLLTVVSATVFKADHKSKWGFFSRIDNWTIWASRSTVLPRSDWFCIFLLWSVCLQRGVAWEFLRCRQEMLYRWRCC